MINIEKIKDIGFKNISFATMETLSFFVGAWSMALEVYSSFFNGGSTNPNLIILSSITFAIFAVTVIVHISSLSDQITNSTPKLIFGNPYFTKDIFLLITDDPFLGDADNGASFGNVDFLRIDISNMPKNPTEFNDAKSVRAIVDYYNGKGIRMGKQSEGRWASGEKPKSRREVSKVSSINIKSNGESQKLDLAILWKQWKGKNGDICIFNNETLFLGPELSEENKKDFKLDDRETFVRIKLMGIRGKGEQWLKFRFRNKTAELLNKKPEFKA